MRTNAPATIDAYLAALAPGVREVLSNVRAIVRAAAPEAVESISYGLPTFKLHGQPLVYFGAAKNHCALYGVPDLPELATHDTSGKGTVRFTPERPLPPALIKRLLKARMERIAARAPARSRRAKKR